MDVVSFFERLKMLSGGKAGMVLVHNGIVRDHSRDGRPVASIDVEADSVRLEAILEEARRLPGITAVLAEVRQGHLKVGEDVMLLGVAGDIRDNVISAMTSTLDRIKKEVTKKKEYRD
ncbi:MAG: molybdenum cofactor biosynthesis protein MoaE [Desulfobacteraceae bacterium]|nr:molybdenum cofactor biosynthesis protein MoaE [Desulfobacteraceae bacterium]